MEKNIDVDGEFAGTVTELPGGKFHASTGTNHNNYEDAKNSVIKAHEIMKSLGF
ncbi:MAG: hypothetical protein [Bacteriophage sp.]|nr:MAG: hypothetical protein [Bacteriophage sp.]